MGCEICLILATSNDGADAVVIETAHWRVVLDPDQRVLGKMFVTLLEHKAAISDLSKEQWLDLQQLMQRLEARLTRVFQPSHFNWQCLMNNAAAANQPTHVHWHFHPRYKQPVQFAGETFHDTELYLPKKRTHHDVDKDVLAQISRAIIEQV